jgi:GT2 family glycosyltransferase
VRAEGYDWLLTLDQDTALPADFFSAIEPGLRVAKEDPRIGAIVPHLAEGERLLSPAYVGLCRTKPMPASFAGVPAHEPRAFNSAALLRVEALDAIGGFDPCFWLDHLDSWLHHQLYVHGWRMYVLDSVHLEHHFSLLNYRDRVSLAHLRNFLAAESAYFDLYCSPLAGAAHTLQLAGRLVKQALRRETREVRRATWSALWQRLTVAKSKRVAAWRGSMGGWPGATPAGNR